MADTSNTMQFKIGVDSTGVSTATKDLTEIKSILTSIASNTKGALSDEFKAMGNAADDVVKKISAIKTVEQQLESQISRTKRAYQLANDTDAVDKLADKRKISTERAQSIYDRALETRSTKLQATSSKIMDGEIALGKTYAKNIGLLEQTIRLLGLAGKGTGDLTSYTKSIRVDQATAKATTAIPKEAPSYVGYVAQLSAAKAKAEELHQVMLKNNTVDTRKNFADARAELQLAVKASDEFNKSLGIGVDKVGVLGSFSQKLRSHFNWILAGELIGAFATIPTAIESIARETEILGQKLKQNLELSERYHNNTKELDGDIKHLSDVAGVFAVSYGANVKDVMEMMQILSRRFKSPEELTYYTNLAMTMHKLDFVTPKKAAEDLEAVILSMGLDFHQAKDFVDQFSVAVEVAA